MSFWRRLWQPPTPPPPIVGAYYYLEKDLDPWGIRQEDMVQVLAVKDGWVKYRYLPCGGVGAMKLKVFSHVYKPG